MLPIRLKEIRTKSHITQSELGKKINVTKSTVSMWEKGFRSPDINTLSILADFFHVSTDYLLGKTSIATPYKDISSSFNGDNEISLKPKPKSESNMTITQLSQNIILQRKLRNWSQAELARRVKLDSTVVNKIEKGNRKVYSEELKAFAKVFDISMDRLACNTRKNNTDELAWQDLGMAYGGQIPDELKDMYRAIAEEYIKKHPEVLKNK